MKIRNGFVSNSSSSSFVISLSENNCATVFDLAKKMIRRRDFDDNESLITKLDKLVAEGIDPNTNISFNSCNYETYIVKEGDLAFINTCNNHDFEQILTVLHDEDDCGNEDWTKKLETLEEDHQFLSPYEGVLGAPLRGWSSGNYCHQCWRSFWTFHLLTGEAIELCPNCLQDKNGHFYKREELAGLTTSAWIIPQGVTKPTDSTVGIDDGDYDEEVETYDIEDVLPDADFQHLLSILHVKTKPGSPFYQQIKAQVIKEFLVVRYHPGDSAEFRFSKVNPCECGCHKH